MRTPGGSLPRKSSLFFSRLSSPQFKDPVVTPPDEDSEALSPSSPTSGLFDKNGTIKSSATSLKSSRSEKSVSGSAETKDKDLTKEKSGIGDWVGGWWGGQRRKRTQSTMTADSASVLSEHQSPEPENEEEQRRSSIAPSAPATPDPSDLTVRKVDASAVGATMPFRKMSHAKGMLSALGLGSATSTSLAEPLVVPETMIASPSSQTEQPPLPLTTSFVSPPSISGASTTASHAGSRAPSLLSSFLAASDSTQAQSRPVAAPSHLRAIFNSTRIMTSDSSSILVDGGNSAGDLVRRLALELIKNARDNRLDLDDKRAAALRGSVLKPNWDDAESVHSPDIASSIAPSKPLVRVDSSMATSLAATALGQVTGNPPTSKLPPSISTRSNRLSSMAALASPFLGAFASKPSKPADKTKPAAGSSTPINPAPPSGIPTINAPTQAARPGTVELESIHPALSRPPTLFLTRSALSSSSFKPNFPHSTASRFTVTGDGIRRPTDEEPLLTDRYGFIYDVSSYYVNMLLRAKEASSTAPSSFTGVKVKELDDDDEDSDGTDGGKSKTDMEVIRGHCSSCEGSQAGSGDIGAKSEHAEETASTAGAQYIGGEADAQGESLAVSPSMKSAKLPATLTSALSPAKPSVSLSAPALGGPDGRRRISDSPDPVAETTSPTHACSTTVSLLLSQLTEIHDKQQATQKADWDGFLKKRKAKTAKTLSATTGGGPSSSTSTSRAAALFGLGIFSEDEEVTHSEGLIGVAQMGRSANKEDWKEFSKLVRNGIPLVYRPKVWLECSGALEMMEPGVYQELLSSHEGQTNSVLTEIEKDVSRTMPLNIFFGGDGVGVSKLRRVLQAYSW